MSLFASFSNIRKAHAEIETLRAKVAGHDAVVAEYQGKLEQFGADLAAAKAELDSEKARVAELTGLLEAAKSEAKSAEDRAAEIVAAQGLPADRLPKEPAKPTTSSTMTLVQFRALSYREKQNAIRSGVKLVD